MLKTVNRLKSRKDFEKVFKKGRVVSGQLFLLRGIPNGKDATRVGFAVSTKIDKRSVVRNRLRRRLREIFRIELLPHLVNGYDLVVIAKPGSQKAEFAELRAAAARAVRQAGLLRPEEKTL